MRRCKTFHAPRSTRAPFEATVGEFREAEEALAGVTALQEVRLEAGERQSAFAGEGRLIPKGK